MLNFVRKIVGFPAFWIVVGLLGAGLISNLASGQSEDSSKQSESKGIESSMSLMREGTKVVNAHAFCRSNGDRLVVALENQDLPIVALENLAAQRILKAVMDDLNDERWVVNGQITEFQGHNYLLLDRVSREARGSVQ